MGQQFYHSWKAVQLETSPQSQSPRSPLLFKVSLFLPQNMPSSTICQVKSSTPPLHHFSPILCQASRLASLATTTPTTLLSSSSLNRSLQFHGINTVRHQLLCGTTAQPNSSVSEGPPPSPIAPTLSNQIFIPFIAPPNYNRGSRKERARASANMVNC